MIVLSKVNILNRAILLMGFFSIISSCANSQKKENKIIEEHEFTNQLIDESSPYLLQHAHNPVNWMPWGDEAFDKAKEEDKLVLVSIGY